MEAKRLEERVKYDMEMIRELGYCRALKTIRAISTAGKQGVRPFAYWIISRKIF